MRPMREPEIAIAFTPDPWVERLHRHFADHGGARVRQLVFEPATLLDESFDVLVASHRWPALTQGLVSELHDRGRRVLGVFDPEEPSSLQVVERAGVDRSVAADARPREVLEALIILTPDPTAVDMGVPDPWQPSPRPKQVAAARTQRVVVSGPAGSGSTEIAIELARRLGSSHPTVLVDADEVAPAVATRLALPIEPNLRTAIESVEHGSGDVSDWVIRIAGGFDVIVGLPNVHAWEQVRATEVERVLRATETRGSQRVVVDVAASLEDVGGPRRGRHAVTRAVVTSADRCVAVGAATPVGVARLVAWVADLRLLAPEIALDVVVNRAPRDGYRCRDIEQEISATFPAGTVTFVPFDRRVETAAWDGELVSGGAFTKAITPVVSALERPCRGAVEHAA
jgi:MinD superfamily P-loop ATPase